MEYKQLKLETKEAVMNPKVGDMFHEMYSWYGLVIECSTDGVKLWEPYSERLTVFNSVDEFAKYLGYSGGLDSGTWALLHSRGNADRVKKAVDFLGSAEYLNSTKTRTQEEQKTVEASYQKLLLEKCKLVGDLERIEVKISNLRTLISEKR